MKYLVIAHQSFYGRNFVELLREKGEKVYLTGRMEDIFGIPDCDWVVNFASKSLVAESWEKPQEWLKTNVMDTCSLFHRLKECSARYLHVGTPEVYGSNKSWLKERRDFLPTTPYAVSRACADMMLYAYWKAYKFPMIITRTSNIYGYGQQDYRLIPKCFRYLRNGAKFPLQGKGDSIRSFIHVKDACEALWLLSKKGKIGETYHISTEKAHSIYQVVQMICSLLKKDLSQIEFTQDRLGKDYAYLLNSDKIRSLGWKDSINLEEGLKDYADRTADLEGSRGVSEEPRKALQIPG